MSVASLNTHDMPTFRAFCEGLDIQDRARLRLIPRKDLPRELAARQKLVRALRSFLKREGYLQEDTGEIRPLFEGTLRWLAATQAEFVLVNAEDLWLEEHPQNVPGTSRERPNWRRRMRFGIEEMFRMPEVERIFSELTRLRQRGGSKTKRRPAVQGRK
jgi:4-alpha-glucanotransferase